MFDLEAAIKKWKRGLAESPVLEDGYRDELEAHLRDKIADLTAQGANPEEAFLKAVAAMGESGKIDSEFFKARTTKRRGRPSWQPPWFMPGLVWSYLKISWRTIRRQRSYALVVIAGLSIGFGIFLFFFRLYDWARSVDTFHQDVDRIHCVVQAFPSADGREDHLAFVPPPLASALKDEIPEVEETTRFYQAGRMIVASGGRRFFENQVLCVEPNFLSFFDFPLLAGDRKALFDKPNSVVLTRSLAEKYFGRQEPLGKVLTLNNQMEVMVTGVVMDWSDLPSASSITFSMLVSLEAAKGLFHLADDWTNHNQTAFVRMARNADPAALASNLDVFVDTHYPVGAASRSPRKVYFVPLRHIYYFAPQIRKYDSSNFMGYSIFLGMGVLFLSLVCLNYMNLATARAMDRAKEIGLRKVVGANRRQLVRQFLCESVLISFLALPPTLLAYKLISTALMARLGVTFDLSLWSRTSSVLAFGLIPLTTGVLSGIYPAFVLSSFRPIQILKSKVSKKRRRRAQKIMVVSQFAFCSIFLVLGFVWLKQTGHISRANLGYDRTDVLAIPISEEINPKLVLLQERFKNTADVVAVSASRGLPGRWRNRMNVTAGTQLENPGWTMYAYGVDYGFFELLRMKILEGRSFSRTFTETNSFVVNRSAASLFGWEEPVGKSVNVGGQNGQIIGIVDDFQFDNVHYPPGPAVFSLGKDNLSFLLVRAARLDRQAGLIETLRQDWSAIVPDIPFECLSLDEHFEDVYFSETKLVSEILGGIGGVAVFLSCLGLLALATYSVRTRTKEIAIRKVVGASASSLTRMLGWDFLKFVFLSDVIGLPIAYAVSRRILNSAYAVRTTIDAGILILTGFLTLGAAVAAVGSQALKTAVANPVDSLRHE
ncbi:MAG: ABC transporter permease [Candidatus Aminicenantes bacterium]|nr:ABC transporter permease [Candidatus Aminicenantes bacterium]